MTEVDIAEGDLKGFAYSRSFIVPIRCQSWRSETR